MASSKLVWTSDPETAKQLREKGQATPTRDTPAEKQTIHVGIDRKRRAGKVVTVASGFAHPAETLAALAGALKKRCGSGGTAREGDIEIQGDHVATVAAELEKRGYRVRR